MRGRAAERQAEAWLKQQGLRLLDRNYRCRMGEIDLIMRDRDETVMVEVRSRSRTDFGGAAASVSVAKQQRLIRAALFWQAQHPQAAELAMRFDVIAIDGGHIRWIRDAFNS